MQVKNHTKLSTGSLRTITTGVIQKIQDTEGTAQVKARPLVVHFRPSRSRVTVEYEFSRHIIVNIPPSVTVRLVAWGVAYAAFRSWWKVSDASADRAARDLASHFSETGILAKPEKVRAPNLRVEANEEKAHASLARAETALADALKKVARARKRVTKYRKKVAYYDRRRRKIKEGDPAVLSKTDFARRMSVLRRGNG